MARKIARTVGKLAICTCGAFIYWCWTANGKRIPINCEPQPDAAWSVIAGGVVVRGGDGPRYVVHLDVCPDADKHRKASA